MGIIGYLRDGYRWLAEPYRWLDDALARRGLTFRTRLPVLGGVLMTGDPGLIGEIVRHKDLGGGKAVTALRAILGARSLIMLGGAAHAERRRLVAPLFSGEGLTEYDELTRRVTRAAFTELPRGQTFAAYDVARRVGLRAMVAAMFGDGSAAAGQAEGVVERFLNSFRNPLVLFCPLLRVDAGPRSPWGRALRNREALCDFIRRRLDECAGRPRDGTLLGRLVAEAPARLEREDLVEEVLSLLLFGHDTAAATMAWAFAHLFDDRDAAERVRAEAVAAEGAPFRPESLPFLEACVHESMRLCPVVVHLARTAAADLRLGGHAIRQGEKVIPCTYLAQHNPAVFPEPGRFRPERFLNGRRYEHSYFPFGFGGRTCVGKPFAMRQMLLVLSEAVRSADLRLAPGYRPAPTRNLVLIVPRGGTPMRRR